MHSQCLSSKSRANIAGLARAISVEFGAALRGLFLPLKERSEQNRGHYNYCFYRYKTMAMATHSPTAIPPTFAGCIGVLNDGTNIDARLWRVMVDALGDDVRGFVETAEYVLKVKNGNEKEWNGVCGMAAKERRPLRILDSVSYQSVCALIQFESIKQSGSEREHYEKLVAMRKDIRAVIGDLAENGLLFLYEMKGLDGNVLDSCFLTDDCKMGREAWSMHLMSGVLLNFWSEKQDLKE
jgi:hypothetical protein